MEKTERIIGVLDSEEDESRRLELVLETDEEVPRLALKLSTFSEGLGWNTQKTIYIDAKQAEQMQFLLGGARSLMKQVAQSWGQDKKAEAGPRVAKVMEFHHSERKTA